MVNNGQIRVVAMRQKLHEVRNEDDDWTGLTDPKERRKRQNRLHARAWRKRKAGHGQDVASDTTLTGLTVRDKSPANTAPATADITWATVSPPSVNTNGHHSSSVSSTPDLPSARYPPTLDCRSPCFASTVLSIQTQLIPPLIPYLTTSSSSPDISTLSITFPLSSDHYLLTLAQYNVLRATMTNLAIVSLLDNFPPECGAARQLIDLLPHPASPDAMPATFAPTALQRAVAHEYWIDAVPTPEMRDNMIRYRGRYDEDELCRDLCGGLYDGFDEVELRGILVWSDPWCVEGWEVTEGFARKWGFLLRGCGRMIEASNRWREGRGESRLVVEV